MDELGNFKVFIAVDVPFRRNHAGDQQVRVRRVCIHTSFCTRAEARKQLAIIKAANDGLRLQEAQWTVTDDLLNHAE